MTIEERLKAAGATDEDLKVLVTPATKKVFEETLKAASDALELAKKHEGQVNQYKSWYETQAMPGIKNLEDQLAAKDAELLAEKAGNAARLKKLTDAGLLELQKQGDEGTTPKPGEPAKIDTSKFSTVDQYTDLARATADSIAVMADIQDEHRELGLPRTSWEKLRAEAFEAKKPLRQYWVEKFGVEAKRSDKAAADKAAYEKKIADDAVAAYRSTQGNPMTVSSSDSINPFTNKAPSKQDAEVPWLKTETVRGQDRMANFRTKHAELFN